MAISFRSFLVLAVLALSACDSAEERAEKHFQSGLELLNSGDPRRALVEFRNVFALDQTHSEARLAYARTARILGNVSESYSNFLNVTENAPQNMEARLALTEMAIVAQNWDEAERHGAVLIDAQPAIEGSEIPLLALEFREAVVEADQTRIREATRRAETLAEAHPENQILHRILIEGYTADNELDKALSVTDRAIAAAPDNELFYRVKGTILARKQDPELLENHLRETIAKFPNDDESKSFLVRLLANVGDLQGAQDFLRSEIAIAENKVSAHVTLIAFIQQADGSEAALAEVEAALPLYEDSNVLKALQAGLLFDQGSQDEAVTILQGVVENSEPSTDTDSYRVTLARMLVSTGNEVGARQLVSTVLERDPNQVEALKMTAAWLIESDEADKAVATLRQALDQEPEDAEAMTLMARAHERNGNSQLAQDLLALAVDASGNAPGESLRFANLLVEQERYAAAETVLINALRANSGNQELLRVLGDLYLQTEDWPRAEQVVATLKRNTSETAQLAGDQLQLQIISRVEGRDQGIAFLEEMIATEDDNSAAKIALIRARLADGNSDRALTLANELVAEFPDNPRAKQVLASTLFATGDAEAAEDTLREVAQSTGVGSDVLQYARVLGAQGKADEARQAIENGLKSAPESPDLLWAKASYLEQSNDIDGAIDIYEQLYATSSSSQIIANNLASLLATYRDDQESLDRAFTVARRLRGTEVPPFQDTYGWILFRLGNVEEALTYLEPAAQRLENDPIVQYHLGRAYQDLGRNDEAIKQYDAAIDIAGEDDPRGQISDAGTRKSELSQAVQE
ncbi:tetratricopeptide repeat protein [Rhodobacteraceae bacterium]|nr:tetratricopeptide repeat protein [Paracoccaceae bacterium]